MVLVLDQGTPTDLLHPYLTQLAKPFFAKLVRYDSERRQFLTHKDNYREGVVADEPLERLTEVLGAHQITSVAINVKDPTRQQQSFSGQLVGAYGKRLGREVVLPRIFKNFAVQPYFNRGVWDLDRIYCDSARRTYGVIEMKHKYPFGMRALQFGINCGSCGVLRDLGSRISLFPFRYGETVLE